MYAGSQHVPIEGFGLVPVPFTITNTTTCSVMLKIVEYVTSFHGCVFSFHCFEVISGHWDTSSKQLMLNG
jgi:hypothetical protein